MKPTTKAILNISQGLADVNRYSQVSLVKDESVLEHIGFCSVMGYLLTKQVQALGEDISLEKVLSKCAVHDMEEFMTGDIPHTFKNHSGILKESLNNAGYECISELSEIVNSFGDIGIKTEWLYAKSDMTKEGLMMKALDCFAVINKAHSEVIIKGNKSLIHHAQCIKDNGTLRTLRLNFLEQYKYPIPVISFIDDLSKIVDHIVSLKTDLNKISIQSKV